MSMVTTLVSLSQFIRALSHKLRDKVIKAIELRIAKVECEQRKCEAHRSKQMVECHNEFYEMDEKLEAIRDRLIAKINRTIDAKQDKLASAFNERKAIIATSHQGASNQLKRELAMLGSELDNLTK